MASVIDIVKKGATNRSVTIRIIDSTDGTPETGVVWNTAGIDLWYRRESSAVVSVTEATLALLTTAHADGGFLHISHGEYRFDLPDAAFATGANHVEIGGTVTGMVVIGGRVRLVDYDPEDATRLGLTALPNAAADAAGGLPISDAGGLGLDAVLSGHVPQTTDHTAAIADIPTVAEFNARTLVAASYFDATADTVANVTTVGSVTGAVGSVTGATGSVTGAVGSVAGNVDGNVTGSVGSLVGHTVQTADHTAGIADLPTVAEFNARTLLAASYGTAANQTTIAGYIDVEIGTIITDVAAVQAAVDLIPTTAMRGTDDAALASVCTEARLALLVSGYLAHIIFTDDEANSKDEYTVTWFKDGVRVTSGITVPKIQVIKRADGLDLVALTAMTQIGTTGSYKYDEATNRITSGEAVVVHVEATIDGAGRTFAKDVSRDST